MDEIFEERLKKHAHFEPMLTAGPIGLLDVSLLSLQGARRSGRDRTG